MIGLCIPSSIVPSSAWIISRTDQGGPTRVSATGPHRTANQLNNSIVDFTLGAEFDGRQGGGVDHYRVGQPVRHVSEGIWDRYVALFISVGGPSQGRQYSNHWLARDKHQCFIGGALSGRKCSRAGCSCALSIKPCRPWLRRRRALMQIQLRGTARTAEVSKNAQILLHHSFDFCS